MARVAPEAQAAEAATVAMTTISALFGLAICPAVKEVPAVPEAPADPEVRAASADARSLSRESARRLSFRTLRRLTVITEIAEKTARPVNRDQRARTATPAPVDKNRVIGN